MLNLKNLERLIYQYWIAQRPGSYAVYESDFPVTQLTISLEGISEGRISVKSRTKIAAGTRSKEEAFDMVLLPPAKTDPTPLDWAYRERQLSSASELAAQAEDYWVKRGEEIITAQGEDHVCQRYERRSKYLDMPLIERCWLSVRVPGGVVKIERKLGDAPSPDSWTLKAYEGA